MATLIVTADAVILDDLLRLAAAADAKVEVANDVERARAAWQAPPLVLVGDDLADDLARARPARRSGVVLVTRVGEENAYRQAVQVGAQDVMVLPDTEAWLVDRMAAAADPAVGQATTVCVVGGRGGAGASVLAAALALAGTRAAMRSLLVDGDPFGGGIDLVLGQEGAPGARWPDFIGRRGRLSSAALHGSLLRIDRLTVLSGHRRDGEPIPAEAMRSVLAAAARGFDLVVVDLPRHLSDAATEALLAARTALIVVPAEVRATVAADQVAAAVRRYAADVRVVVREPAPGGLSAQVIAQSLNLPLVGTVTTDRRLAAALERGDPPDVRGRLADLCGRFLAGLEPHRRSEAT